MKIKYIYWISALLLGVGAGGFEIYAFARLSFAVAIVILFGLTLREKMETNI